MDIAFFSQQGDRKVNEDYIKVFQTDNLNIFLLADGLGGHQGGCVASKVAVDTICEFDKTEHGLEPEMMLEHSFKIAHFHLKDIQRENESTHSFMTTLVMFVIYEDCVVWGHVGDSRLYVFREDQIIDRTIDDSVIQQMVLRGELSEIEMRYHKDRNKIVKALGSANDDYRPTINSMQKREGDKFLLCTDGLWENVNETEMEQELSKSKNAHEWLGKMEAVAQGKNSAGRMDNYSAIAIFT